MSPFHKAGARARSIVLVATLSAGCRTAAAPINHDRAAAAPSDSVRLTGAVKPVVYQEVIASGEPGFDDSIFDQSELSLDLLVAEVLRRNPSVVAMVAAWQAAYQRYPQVVSLDDPMTRILLGPGSIGSSDVDFGWSVEASQKVPWPGKRQLRGQMAQSEADAAFQDIEESRQRLSESARQAYFDYFLVARQQEINADNFRVMQEFRRIAETRYESNQVPQQDVFQAEVELAELGRRQAELERMLLVTRARLNTLLHRSPDLPLPAPPSQMDAPDKVPPAATLRRLAIERRPDLSAQAARIRAEQASVELACKEFCPDLEFVARYDAFWQTAERDLRPQAGMNLNLPVARDRRRAAVSEAIAKVEQRRAELELRKDEIQNEVQSAVARLDESRQVIKIYEERILPAAEKNIESAQAGYEAGKVDFLRLIEAQRQLIQYREKQYEAVVDYHRRHAELERAVAGPLPDQDTE